MQLSTSLRFLVVSSVTIIHALQLPPAPSKDRLLPDAFAKALATTALCTCLITSATVLPLPAAGATVDNTALRVDLDVPYLLDLVKTEQARSQTIDRVQFLEDSIKSFLGPAVKIALPTDYKGLVKKALSGSATVLVNGQQQVDLQVVQSDFGSLTVQVKSPLLPKLPFVGLPGTPAVVESAAEVLEDATPAAVQVWQKLTAPREPFWTKTVAEVSLPSLGLYKELTRVDILGVGSLGLGAVYAASYAYYKEERRWEKEAAPTGKISSPEKKRQKPSTKKKALTKQETTFAGQKEGIESTEEQALPEVQVVPPMAAAGQTAVAVVEPVITLPISSEPQLKRASSDTHPDISTSSIPEPANERTTIRSRIRGFFGRFRKRKP